MHETAARCVAENSDAWISSQIIEVFNTCFAVSENTILVGGAAEPFYQPGLQGGCHQLFFREDFARSALHESAHWCIAGRQRRQLPDFGYWYNADGRGEQQQRQFEAVEVRPQALEYLFCCASGLRFQVSTDNLNGDAVEPFPFQMAVWQQVRQYLRIGLPARAALFRRALAARFAGPTQLRAEQFHLHELTGR